MNFLKEVLFMMMSVSSKEAVLVFRDWISKEEKLLESLKSTSFGDEFAE